MKRTKCSAGNATARSTGACFTRPGSARATTTRNVYFEINANVFRALHHRKFEDNNGACSEVGCTNSDMRSAHVIDMLAKDYHAIVKDGTFKGLPLEHAVAFWSTLRDLDRELVKAGSVGLSPVAAPRTTPSPGLTIRPARC